MPIVAARGPWRLTAVPAGWLLTAADGSEVIVDTFDTDDATARLIAAAPEMATLAAALLEEVDAHLDYHDDDDMQADADALRALLARIEGGQ